MVRSLFRLLGAYLLNASKFWQTQDYYLPHGLDTTTPSAIACLGLLLVQQAHFNLERGFRLLANVNRPQLPNQHHPNFLIYLKICRIFL